MNATWKLHQAWFHVHAQTTTKKGHMKPRERDHESMIGVRLPTNKKWLEDRTETKFS